MLEVLASLYRLSQNRPTAPAFTEGQRTLTYAELAARVGGLSQDLNEMKTGAIGILAPNGLEWVIADLSLSYAGKTAVPLPVFFSPDQLRHIVSDAAVTHALVTQETRTMAEGLGLIPIEASLSGRLAPLLAKHDHSQQAQRIIYTSGTTGAPKGVRLGAPQISASTKGLMEASQACAEDRYLSVLPFSLLLEQIAGIYVPLLAGAPVILAPHVAGAALQGETAPLMEAFTTSRATTTVLVPGILEAYVRTLAATANAAPSSLRFVAVGGAPVNRTLAEQAWALGVPVHEGYGLSECCSVVSVNRPGKRIAGTAGEPIPGVYVTLEDGEIVVRSKTVMNGYLGHGESPKGIWHTGDLGEFTDCGALRILGRKDNLIVTQAGRNISPEWVESTCEAVPGIDRTALTYIDGHGLVLIVSMENDNGTTQVLQSQLAALPKYAQPDHIACLTPADMAQRELLSPLGDVRRNACAQFARDWLRHHAA